MKKLFIIFILPLLFAACSKSKDSDSKGETVTIRRLYDVKLPSYKGYSTYVIRTTSGQDLYLIRWKVGIDLFEGDEIDIEISPFCQYEISKVNGVDLNRPEETDEQTQSSRGLITSDPIETDIIDIFTMEFVEFIPLLPIPCYCIEDDKGELLVVKKAKVDVELGIGDRIVYNVYTLYPNEILMLKKLRD